MFRVAKIVLAAALVCVSAGAAEDTIEGSSLGNGVRVTIYEDLQCGPCALFRETLDNKILPKYAAKATFVHRDFPQGRNEWARSAAMAARWMYEQRPALGIQFRREIMAERVRITVATLPAWVREFASRNKVSEAAAVAALTDERLGHLVDQEALGARARGVTSVPAVYVNAKAFSGTIVADDIGRAIDAALTDTPGR